LHCNTHTHTHPFNCKLTENRLHGNVEQISWKKLGNSLRKLKQTLAVYTHKY